MTKEEAAERIRVAMIAGVLDSDELSDYLSAHTDFNDYTIICAETLCEILNHFLGENNVATPTAI